MGWFQAKNGKKSPLLLKKKRLAKEKFSENEARDSTQVTFFVKFL